MGVNTTGAGMSLQQIGQRKAESKAGRRQSDGYQGTTGLP